MRLQNIFLSIVVAGALVSTNAFAQSKQYQRKKATSAPATTAKSAAKNANNKANTAAPESDKLDISELEQKYWAPKDTDFSVVQNRTYTKAGRYAATAFLGIPVNDPYSSGLAYAAYVNYYFSERYGVEFQYFSAQYGDSDTIDAFRAGGGGGRPPDFNRPLDFIGVGFNWVPFYAKMSVLGSKILYFDMQFTPIIGLSDYEQQFDTLPERKVTGTFTYGIDITQYFFMHKNLALRFNLQNRWSKQEVRAAAGGNEGSKLRDDTDHTSVFLFGVTYFH